MLFEGVHKSPASGILQRHMNLNATFLFKIGLYWLQRKVLNFDSKCSTITENMKILFNIFFKSSWILRQFPKILEPDSQSLSAQVWQHMTFNLPPHKLMQASHEKGLTTSCSKGLPNLCLLTREAFWKGLRSTANFFASFKKIQVALLYSRPHRLKSFLKWRLLRKERPHIHLLKHWNPNAILILYIISQCYKKK